MKLCQMDPLPDKAGIARINFSDPVIGRTPQWPSRKEDEIRLPRIPEAEFFSLNGGTQFLVLIPDSVQLDCWPRLWFGGTDEQAPFLTAMRMEPFKRFERDGEKGFFAAIKPEEVSVLEKRYRVKAQRQGDWFAVPLPFTWKDLGSLFGVIAGKALFHGELRIGNTRHIVTGKYMTWQEYFKPHIIAEGILRAPNHAPKKLIGPHALFQTAYLAYPSGD